MKKTAERLFRKVRKREARVGVIGLGYVGLPLALALAEKGFPVTGFDTDGRKTLSLSRGKSYLSHLPASRVAAAVKRGSFSATTAFGKLGKMDVIMICVPTPLTRQREPDMSYIVSTARDVKASLRSGQLVILESTTYPGTTEELLKGILEQSGLVCGRDFFLAFSPEREDPGNPDSNVTRIPKVVGGVDRAAGDLAEALYGQIVSKTVRVSTARAAEATKLVENIFRAVNIALVNELKMVFDRMDISIWEVLEAASTKPFGFMRFNPGPGWGGHCIPLDPFYLSWKAREHGIAPKFIELAGEVNVGMPHWVVNKLVGALNERGKPIKGSRVLLLGLAYKKDIGDTRESPALEIMALLEKLGARLAYHDPYVPRIPPTRHSPQRTGMRSVSLNARSVSGCDAVLVVTDHTNVDYSLIAKHARLIVDSRGVVRRQAGKTKGRLVEA